MSASAEPSRDARSARLAALAVALLALLPSLGTLRAPWIAEDASILAQVAADGPWSDWTRSQFGMRVPLFWRPLISTSWALQEACTGISPLALRLLNLALHAGIALLAFASVRRLSGGWIAALLAGAWIGLFPEQGGTSTWIAGRTDLLCAFFLLASVFATLGRRPALAAPLAFLAASAKEFGFLAPLWAGAFLWARNGQGEGQRESRRDDLRRLAPTLLGAGAAFLWRRVALGGFSGGYAASLPPFFAGLSHALQALLVSAWPSVLALLLLLAAGAWQRSLDRRGVSAALAAALLATVLLYPLLADGHLEPENRRLLYVPECALALAFGLACRNATRLHGAALLGLVLLAPRLVLAWNDTHDWARSAREGEVLVARARSALAHAAPSGAPVFFDDFPISRHQAYCLGFGVSARFRAPFPLAPRPVWPWRLLFVPQAQRERRPLTEARADGSLWPLDDPPRVPRFELLAEDGQPAARVALDERALLAPEDHSPRLGVKGGPPDARLEALFCTELGYEPIPVGELDARGAGGFSLMQLLTCTNGVASVADVLSQAADLGARNAWFELRALGADRNILAAAPWCEVVWPTDLANHRPSAR